jgi:hypothetical protein
MGSWRFRIEAASCLLAASIGLWKIGELRPRWKQLHSAHQKLLEQAQPLQVIDPARPQVRLRSREGFDFLFDCYLPVGNGAVALKTSNTRQLQSVIRIKPQWTMIRIRLDPGEPQSFLFYAGPDGSSRSTLQLPANARWMIERPESVQIEVSDLGRDFVLDDSEKSLQLLRLTIDPESVGSGGSTDGPMEILRADLEWE